MEVYLPLSTQQNQSILILRFPLEKRIKEKIVGQEGAVTTVAAAIRRKGKAFLQPTPSFLFERFAAIEDGGVAA